MATNKKFVEKLPSNRTVDTRLSGQKNGVVVGMGDNVITAYNVSGIDTVVIDGGGSNVVPSITLRTPAGMGGDSELRMDQVLLSKNALSLAQSWLSGTELKMDKLSLTKDKLSLDGASFGSDGITLPKGAKAIMPGVLAACTVRADGTKEYSYDGPIKVASSIQLTLGKYEITHNIGHTDYVATATVIGVAGSENSCVAIIHSQNGVSINIDIKKSTNGSLCDSGFSLVLIGILP